jgi:transposase-like protein
MLSSEVWAKVRRLHEDGVPIKRIARDEGLAPNTVRRLVRAVEPPRYRRPARGSLVEPFEARIVRMLREEPWLTAAVIGRRVSSPAGAGTCSGAGAVARPGA